MALILLGTGLSGCEVADDVGIPASHAGPSALPSAARPPQASY
ncbi:hypothetical protein [Arthrobacter sp. UYEF3]